MKEQYKKMLEEYQLPNGVTLRNRLMMAPMTNYSSQPDGNVTKEEVTYYKRRAKGVGAIITAVANIMPEGKGFDGQIGVDRDELVPGLAKLATAIKEEGAKTILQIFHAGRMSPPHLVPDGDVTSASNIPAERPGEIVVPRELTKTEIGQIIEAFGQATRRAMEAGFDGVEIHGANGYLIQQFFSPHSNRRTDEYGGDVNERMTFPLAVINRVKEEVKKQGKDDFIVGYRFSPEEPETPGITMGETLKFVDVLADQGLDYLHVSLMDFHSKARREADNSRTRIDLLLETIGKRLPLIGVGSLYTADDVAKAFDSGIELIGLGRELVIEPEWVEKVQADRSHEIEVELDLDGREKLDMPEAFWNVVTNVPGWFPGVR